MPEVVWANLDVLNVVGLIEAAFDVSDQLLVWQSKPTITQPYAGIAKDPL
jgi:hypothetical protein